MAASSSLVRYSVARIDYLCIRCSLLIENFTCLEFAFLKSFTKNSFAPTTRKMELLMIEPFWLEDSHRIRLGCPSSTVSAIHIIS